MSIFAEVISGPAHVLDLSEHAMNAVGRDIDVSLGSADLDIDCLAVIDFFFGCERSIGLVIDALNILIVKLVRLDYVGIEPPKKRANFHHFVGFVGEK